MAELLLDAGADVHHVVAGMKSSTPLFFACQNRHAAMVELLLDRGADVNHVNAEDNTPLGVAVGTRDRALCRLLVARGATLGRAEGPEDRDAQAILETLLKENEGPAAAPRRVPQRPQRRTPQRPQRRAPRQPQAPAAVPEVAPAAAPEDAAAQPSTTTTTTRRCHKCDAPSPGVPRPRKVQRMPRGLFPSANILERLPWTTWYI
jgi:hypothetical protein